MYLLEPNKDAGIQEEPDGWTPPPSFLVASVPGAVDSERGDFLVRSI